ncbi:MAG TPA: hypothetical protein VMS32_02385 [Verrucomicrobiae bacterium]|jgi:streptogramin lyase|nr:hypothetical protein [Verrucomicrobiae bacterium]
MLKYSAPFLALVLLAGCGGGSTQALPTNLTPTSPMQSITVRMTIDGPGGATQSSSTRTPKFVSPSTNGVLAQAYSDSGYTTLVTQNAVDVSSGSAACGGATGFPRTCTVTLGVTPSTYWFKFTDYNAAPVSGAFGNGAQVLGIGTVPNFTVLPNVANQLSIFISGLIANLGVGNAAYMSLPADGNVHTIGLVLAPTDASGNPIGTGNAPYANPMTVTLSESGGSGHAMLSLNGGPASSSVTVTRTTDSVVLSYDGKGSPGYSIALSIAASIQQGVIMQALDVSPLYVASVSALYANDTLSFFAPSQSATLNLTEANAPNSVTYTTTPSAGCVGVVGVGTVSGTGASANVTATSGATTSATGCTLALADSLGTNTQIVASATNTGSGGIITVPATVITEYALPTNPSVPSQVAAGPDGNLWFTENSGDKIGKITTTGTITEYQVPSVDAGPQGIAAGPDGNLWFTESGDRFTGSSQNKIGKITAGGTITEYQIPTLNVGLPGIAAGSDGSLWFTLQGQNRIGKITTDGAVTEFSTGISASAGLQGIAAGPDGNLWFIEYYGNRIGRITPTGTVTEFSSGISANAGLENIAAGPDGNLWFTEFGGNRIGRITPTGTVTEFSTGISASAEPNGIAAGPDGNLWFTESSGNNIGRITQTGTVTEFSNGISATALPGGIAAGPDGSLWFTETVGNLTGRIGRITP